MENSNHLKPFKQISSEEFEKMTSGMDNFYPCGYVFKQENILNATQCNLDYPIVFFGSRETLVEEAKFVPGKCVIGSLVSKFKQDEVCRVAVRRPSDF